MTYEEWILIQAEEKCDRLYKLELIHGGSALILMLFYVLILNTNLIIWSTVFIGLCGIEELSIMIINRRAIKHVNRRLRRLSISLNVVLKRFPKDKLRLETMRFKRDYGFLKNSRR